MQPPSTESWTVNIDVVAWYAAIVATASAIASVYAIRRDRAKLKVSASPNIRLQEPCRGFSTDEDLIAIEAANVGRRPITLGLFWFTQTGRKEGIEMIYQKPDWQPSRVLGEGDSAASLLRQRDLPLDVDSLRGVVVRDITGRKWRGRIERSRRNTP